MKIATKYFGEMEIDPSKQIQFVNGLPGFNDETEFVLLDMPNAPLFQVLQSVKTDYVAFITANPHVLYPDYAFRLDGNIIEQLDIKSEEEVVTLSIITLKKPFEKSTMNLKAPIVINSREKLGKQYILNTDKYSSTASIKPALSESEAK